MSNEIMMTNKQFMELREKHQGLPVNISVLIRDVEQAVLQSPEIQSLREDAERWRLFIRNYDEYYKAGYIGGWALQAAIYAAMEMQT